MWMGLGCRPFPIERMSTKGEGRGKMLRRTRRERRSGRRRLLSRSGRLRICIYGCLNMRIISPGFITYGLKQVLNVEWGLREEIPRNPLPPKTTIFFGTVVAIWTVYEATASGILVWVSLPTRQLNGLGDSV